MRNKLHIFVYLILMTFLHLPKESASDSEVIIQKDDNTSSPVVHYFYLYPVKNVLPLFLYSDVDEKEVEFKKEPELGRGKIYRKLLPLGKNEKDYIPLAWNVKTAKLYLDFNRNFDLTDDPDNMFDATEKNKWGQIFTNIPIEREIRIPSDLRYIVFYTVDFQLMELDEPVIYLQVNSSWKGEIDLPGIKAQMIVSDNLDGEITTSEKSKGRSRDIYKLESILVKDFSTTKTHDFIKSRQIPDKIHLQNHPYILKFDFVREQKQIVLRVVFQETTPDMGTIRIRGTHIKHLMLSGDYQVHLFSPGEEIKIPSGEYNDIEPILETADAKHRFLGYPGDEFLLDKNGTYELNIGAPLKNSIHVNRFTKYLSIGNVITGIGNEEYVLLNKETPPEFKVYKKNKKIFGDKFRFG